MKTGDVSPSVGCTDQSVTPALKAAIDFPSKKNGHIINSFVYSTSEPVEEKCTLPFFRGMTSCFLT